MKLYLVRHGQTDWNNERRMQGHKNIPMNEVGIQQINDLADRIKKEDIRFDRLICSPLDRAKKSAEIIKDKTGYKNDIIIDEDFIERSNGLLEGEVWTPELDFDDPKYQIETIPELRSFRAIFWYMKKLKEKNRHFTIVSTTNYLRKGDFDRGEESIIFRV